MVGDKYLEMSRIEAITSCICSLVQVLTRLHIQDGIVQDYMYKMRLTQEITYHIECTKWHISFIKYN